MAFEWRKQGEVGMINQTTIGCDCSHIIRRSDNNPCFCSRHQYIILLVFGFRLTWSFPIERWRMEYGWPLTSICGLTKPTMKQWPTSQACLHFLPYSKREVNAQA